MPFQFQPSKCKADTHVDWVPPSFNNAMAVGTSALYPSLPILIIFTRVYI